MLRRKEADNESVRRPVRMGLDHTEDLAFGAESLAEIGRSLKYFGLYRIEMARLCGSVIWGGRLWAVGLDRRLMSRC